MARFTVITFGCQMNSHDSDRIGEVLRGAGPSRRPRAWRTPTWCCSTPAASAKRPSKSCAARSVASRLLKRERPGLTIAVAGCVAQQEGEGLLKRMPDIDLVLGPDNIPELPRLLLEAEGAAMPVVRTEFDLDVAALFGGRRRAGPNARERLRDGDEGLQRALHVLHRAAHARPRALPRVARDHRRGARAWSRPGRARSRCSVRP